MKILAIDTSSAVATSAIIEDNKILCEIILNQNKTHSQKLMPIIKEVLDNCELKISDIDAFAVSLGPGSFTGLRIGVATAKAFAHSMNKPIIGINTLDALAYSYCGFDGIVCPIIDARNNQVFTALYDGINNSAKISEYMGIEVSELLKILKEKKEDIFFLGDGVNSFKEIIKEELGERARFSPIANTMQRASVVAELAMAKYNLGKTDNFLNLAPYYLRRSQAERIREEHDELVRE